MGTDIHIYVETLTDDDEWTEVKPPYIRGADLEGYDGWPSWSPDRYWEMEDPPPNPEGRNYNLFAFLADVRNGYGFAGVRTHEAVEPQVAMRGIPEDTSWDEEESGIWLGDHSHTHAMLDELLGLPWDMEYLSGGVVGREQFRVWQEEGIPNSWSGWISGKGVTIYQSPERYAEILDSDEEEYGKDFCFVTWKWQPLLNCGFYHWIQELAKKVDPSRTRIVMGFDS